jgi:hypothetical protein
LRAERVKHLGSSPERVGRNSRQTRYPLCRCASRIRQFPGSAANQRQQRFHIMKLSRARTSAFLVATAFFGGCALSPDYSHYDWSTRGGMVDEQDRSLAAARIEPFQSRRQLARSRADEPLTPPGAPTSRESEVIIDPAGSRPVIERQSTAVVVR